MLCAGSPPSDPRTRLDLAHLVQPHAHSSHGPRRHNWGSFLISRHSTPDGRLRRAAQSPLAHFAVLGSLLYAVGEAIWPAPETRPAPVVISSQQITQARHEWVRATGHEPSEGELDRLVAEITDDELLFRAALARGFQDSDGVVVRRMIANQRFVSDISSGPDELRDAELLHEARSLEMERTDLVVRRRLIERMRDQILTAAHAREVAEESAPRGGASPTQPDTSRVRLAHVFLSADLRGESLEADARALRTRLVGERLDSAAALARGLGDPLLVPARLPFSSKRELAARLGPAFAAGASSLPVGLWSEPLESSYGLHFVWIEEQVASTSRSTDRVATEPSEAPIGRDRTAMRAALARLRRNVEIIVEQPAPETSP
jgi:hypothetical protein